LRGIQDILESLEVFIISGMCCQEVVKNNRVESLTRIDIFGGRVLEGSYQFCVETLIVLCYTVRVIV